MSKLVVVAFILGIALTGCVSFAEQTLSFRRVSDYYSFRTKGRYSTNEPALVIIASENEVTPPEPDLEFLSDGTRNEIAQTDFQHSFVVLMRHGRSANSARIKSVSRQGDTVFLSSSDDSIIGNYVT